MLFKHMMLFGLMFFAADGAGGGGGSDTGGDANSGESGEAGDTGGEGDDDYSTDGLKSALAKERKAASDATRELKKAQRRIQDLENAGKSEEEQRDAALKQAQERAEAAEKRLKDSNGLAAVIKAASASIDPEAVYALAAKDLEFDEESKPTNVTALIEKIKGSNPKLFPTAKGVADGGKTGKPAGYEPSPGFARMSQAYAETDKAAN